MSRQASYLQRQAESAVHDRDRQVATLVRDVRCRQPRIGGRKLHYLLNTPMSACGIKLGRDALFATLKRENLLVPPARAFHKTTNSFHHFDKHPNLLKPKPQLERPEQLWVADITYVPTHDRCVYLSLVTDAFSRKIVGYHVHPTLQTEEVAEALKMALKARRTRFPLIHHSDRGIQYCASAYQALHTRHGLVCSMTDGYDCYQNALAERINGILKTEFLLNRSANVEQTNRIVQQSVDIYNRERPHYAF
jgi:transposase InsO family protein